MVGKCNTTMLLYTIGHSTRPFDEFVEALKSFNVRTLVDIRTIPRSQRVPQFNQDALRASLPRRRIRYRHVPGLGGLRRARADSQNTAWRNLSFRGFADYMGTPQFSTAVEEVRMLAQEMGPVAMMCAEAVPWRCHRSLVADALTVRGDEVVHIMGAEKGSPHKLTPWATVEGTRVTYPGPPPDSTPAATGTQRSAASRPGAQRGGAARRPASRASQQRLL